MKPFDTKGEYTPAEVKAALAGVDGTRQLSFRYERLDQNNNFIENIDYIQSCSIENNALADIKRTAKLDILDTGRMNYLKDRIKPFIRVGMPTERSYRDVVESLNPSVWWTLNDTPTLLESYATGAVTVADGTTYATPTTAYDLTPYEVNDWAGVKTGVALGNAAVRPEFWLRKTTSPAQSLEFTGFLPDTAPSAAGMEIYHATSPIEETLTLVWSGTIRPAYTTTYSLSFPKSGYYFAKTYALTTDTVSPTLEITPSTRLEDSSGNGVYGSTLYLHNGKKTPGLIVDGGTSISEESYTTEWESADDSKMFSLDTGLSFNYWGKYTAKDHNYNSTGISFEDDHRIYFDYDQRDGSNEVELIVSAYRDNTGGSFIWADSVLVPESLIGGSVHMFTYTIDFATSECIIYLDGSERGRLSVPESVLEFLKTPVTKVWWYMFCYTFMEVDDMSHYPVALKGSDVTSLYRAGIGSTTARSGYVEWPQGVFVLSSPSRTMVGGNYVHRDVEGYDQLVTLKEDSFDYRYSVLAGTRYTEAVETVLRSSVAPSAIALTDSLWSTYNGVIVVDENTVNISSTTPNSSFGLNTAGGSASIVGMTVSMSVTGTSDGYILLYTRAGTRDFGFFKTSAGDLIAIHDGQNAYSTTYSATTHKYWRFRESGGLFFWEVSANGSAWTILLSRTNPLRPDETARVIIEGSRATAVSTFVVDNFSYTASRDYPASIVTSTAVLPTTLDWETGTPKLQIINDLLSAINYDSATYDEDGVFVAKPYITPDRRSAEFTYATDETSVITGDVNQTVDLFKIPNKWIAVVSEADRPPLVSTYTNTNPLSPTSTVARGRTIVDFRTEQNAVDQLTLDNFTTRLAFEASQVYEVVEFETGIMPIHQNADVYLVSIDGLEINAKFSEHKWSMTLENGGTMQHTIRRVVSL